MYNKISSRKPALKRLITITIFLCALNIGTTIAAEQIVTIHLPPNGVQGGETYEVKITYDTSPSTDSTLTGIGLRLHWNSNLLELNRITNVFQKNLIAISPPLSDMENFDGDINTDLYIHIAWADPEGNWPGNETMPVDLLAIKYIPITGLTETPPFNITASSTALGYTLQSNPETATLGCSGDNLEIHSKVIQQEQNLSCISNGSLLLGPNVELNPGSRLELISNSDISIVGPIKISYGAVFSASTRR